MFFKRYLCKIFPVIDIQLILWLSLVECEVIVNKIQSKANESSYQFLKATPTPKLLKTTTSIVSDKENATLINNIIPTTIDDDRDGRAQKGKEMEDFEESDYVYESKEPQASTCILNKPEYYMSWWVNEDGSLKLARPMRGQSNKTFFIIFFGFTTTF